MPIEIEHVLGDFDVLDVVEIFVRRTHFVRIAQQRPHQALVKRLKRDDVLAIAEHHPSDRDLVHLSDGFADDGEGVVPDLAVRHEVIRPDQISRIDLAAVDELVDSMVRVDSRATFSSSSFVTSTKVSVSTL